MEKKNKDYVPWEKNYCSQSGTDSKIGIVLLYTISVSN
jgi:hypothetical protein